MSLQNLLEWKKETTESYQELVKYDHKFLADHLEFHHLHDGFIHAMHLNQDCVQIWGDQNFHPEDIDEFPSSQGIYFCCRRTDEYFGRSEIWYIGKANNFRQRWKNHHKIPALKSIRFVSIYFLPIPNVSERELCEIERKYINLFAPVFNDVSPVANDDYPERLSEYQQGFKDGCEKTRQSASDYYSQEIAKLHAQNLELRQRLGL